MNLTFNTALIQGYKSPAQQARILTEDWLARNMYCPICGENTIHRAEPNVLRKNYLCQNSLHETFFLSTHSRKEE